MLIQSTSGSNNSGPIKKDFENNFDLRNISVWLDRMVGDSQLQSIIKLCKRGCVLQKGCGGQVNLTIPRQSLHY